MEILKKILKVICVIILGILFFISFAIGGFFTAYAFDVTVQAYGATGLLIAAAAVMLSLFLLLIIHEAGHLVFGLLSGYSFSSFRVANVALVNKDGKLELCTYSVPGTAGQCLMIPPERDGRIPVVLYNLGGVLMNVIVAAVLTLIYAFAPYVPVLFEILIISAFLSLILAATNGIPFAADVPNDGMNTYYLLKDKVAPQSFRKQLLVNAAQASGKRLNDMPKEWFELPEDADMQSAINTALAVFSASRTMESMDFSAAEQEITELLNSDCNMASIHRNLLTCDLICCRMFVDGDKAEISSLLTINQQKFMKSAHSFISVIRTDYAIALIRDKNAERAEKLKQKFEKMTKNYPYLTDLEQEKMYMTEAEKLFENA